MGRKQKKDGAADVTATEARPSDAPSPPAPDDDLEFPGDAPPRPMDPREADAEAARVAEAIARNRVATGRAAIATFVVATAVFFGVAYLFPESERGLSLVSVALGAGLFVGVGVWALGRSKAPVFDTSALPKDAPLDEETRRIEARAKVHEAKNQRAVIAGAAAFLFAGPLSLYAWSLEIAEENAGREYWEEQARIGGGRGTLVILAAVALGLFVTWVLRPKVDVLSELGGASVEKEGKPASLSAADVAELRAVADEVRRNQRRESLAHGGAVVVFLVVAPIVLFFVGNLLVAGIAGGVVAVAFSRWASGTGTAPTLERLAIPEHDRAWLDRTLSTTSAVTLEVPGDLESLLGRFVGVAVNRWTLLDAGGAAMAQAAELEQPFFRRLLPFQPRTVTVRDLDRTALELVRTPFDGRWRVVADGEAAGTITEGFFGRLRLLDATGAERFRIRRSWLDRRARVIVREGGEVGRMEWPSPGWFSTRLDRPGLVVGMPSDATLADRRLLVAAGLVLDLDRA